MRLAYVANPNSIHTRRWVQHFAGRGHEIHLISDQTPRDSVPPGVHWHRLASRLRGPGLRYLSLGHGLRQLLRELQPDLLHAHTVSPAGWLGAMAGFHPLIVTAWGSDLLVAPGRSPIYHLLARWVLRQADYVTCVSEGLVQAARALGADPGRLDLAPWGIDTEIYHSGGGTCALRAELGLGPGPVVLSMRWIRPVYNPLTIAQAIPHVLRRVPGAQFVIRTYACDADLRAQFKAIIDQEGASEAVHYVGHLPDETAIAELYRLSDLAVSVPSSDGMPLSVLEAMACGTALVLSDIPALREWIQDEREGLFVPPGDVQALGGAVLRLLEDESLRRELAGSGVDLAKGRASREGWMRRYEEIYEHLIQAQQGLAGA